MARRYQEASGFGGFIGANFHYGKTANANKARISRHEDDEDAEDDGFEGVVALHAKTWQNRHPICPYGCGQEGELIEVIMKDGKALGVYRDSEQLKFTADLQMSPKPTGKKITIGADGEAHIVEDV